jgi:antitoxin ParD1/3/4
MATMNISLPKQMKAWVESQSARSQYSNASDYVRALIRKDQDRQKAIATLQAAITEGIESGEAQDFDGAQFKFKMRECHTQFAGKHCGDLSEG